MNPRQQAIFLFSRLHRILLAVLLLWLVGCAETGEIYTTQSISASDSFEIDKRLVGKWSSTLSVLFGMDLDFHFEHDEESNRLYAIFHDPGGCEVLPIYTTRSDEHWFMNLDVRRSYLCTQPRESAAPESLDDFKELYQLVRYQIAVIPIEEVLAVATHLALLEVEEMDHKSFLELKGDIEEEFGFQLHYSDLRIARQSLDRLVAFFAHLSEMEIKLGELEVLSIEPMSWRLTAEAIKSGRLAGHSCIAIAEVEEWNPSHATETQLQKVIDEEIPDSAVSEGDDSSRHISEAIDCRSDSLVISDSAEKIRSLMLRTDESGLFPEVDDNDSPHRNTKTKERLDWRSSGKAFGNLFWESWIRLKVSDPPSKVQDGKENKTAS